VLYLVWPGSDSSIYTFCEAGVTGWCYHAQLLFVGMGSSWTLFVWAVLEPRFPNLCFLSSWDYRHEPPHLVCECFPDETSAEVNSGVYILYHEKYQLLKNMHISLNHHFQMMDVLRTHCTKKQSITWFSNWQEYKTHHMEFEGISHRTHLGLQQWHAATHVPPREA
jgi:hypothetical protein